ncbi:hypothetical protein [Streptomyces sp. NPDC052496]|uniref:hypothetical protein n=1 Tax=Streptomyces sp. NPDC052496 TaxID=3154951 RepID=UPI003432B101
MTSDPQKGPSFFVGYGRRMRMGWLDLWVGRWAEALFPGMVRRVLAGAEPQPRRLPRRVLTVVSADADTTAGVGAVRIVWRPKSAGAREQTVLLERYEGRWRYVGGGGSGPVEEPVDTGMLDVGSGGGALSHTRRQDPSHSAAVGPYICWAGIHVGQEVARLLVGDRLVGGRLVGGRLVGGRLVGDRRTAAPGRRRLIVVWTAAHLGRGTRPRIVALGRDGTELSRLGPHDSLDTHTWARLREEA